MNKHSESQLLRWGIPREVIQYVPNGIDRSEFLRRKGDSKALRQKLGVPQEAIVVLCVGELRRGKGVENLLEAWRIVQMRAEKPVWAIVVGDGALRDQLVSMSLDLCNIVFTGSIPRDDLLSAYEESDLFVMPSEGGEGMPTVLLEAMAAGLPVVATKIPGNIEVSDSEFAKLVNPGDSQQLAFALLDMIHDLASLRQMGRKARLFSRKYDWRIIASRIAEVYESCQPSKM
jgi:glycosyltransferase involved in cell wall biosynthesis